MHRRPAGCRGASLLDVLAATAISVTLLGIGVPQLNKMRAPYALASASRQVAADIQAARLRAIAQNVRYRVRFDPAASGYAVERESSPNAFVADNGLQKLPRGATLTSPTPGNPIFDTRGMLASDVAVSISVPGGGTRTVTVNVLGRTTIS